MLGIRAESIAEAETVAGRLVVGKEPSRKVAKVKTRGRNSGGKNKKSDRKGKERGQYVTYMSRWWPRPILFYCSELATQRAAMSISLK